MLTAIIGGALSGGFSLLSGLGAQKSSAKQQRLQIIENNRVDALNQERLRVANEARAALGVAVDQRSRELGAQWLGRPLVDYERFAADADALGFNRQTYLNSGALSMYQDRAISGDAYKMMASMYATGAGMQAPEWQGTQPTQMQRIPDSMEVLGNAGAAAFNTGLNLWKQQQSQDFQLGMLNRQIEGLASAKRLGGFGGAPSVTTAGQTISTGGQTGVNAGLTSGLNLVPNQTLPYPHSWERGDVEVTNPWFSAQVDRKTANAEAIEDRYGDAVSMVYGVYVGARDLYTNVRPSLRGWANVLDYRFPRTDYTTGGRF